MTAGLTRNLTDTSDDPAKSVPTLGLSGTPALSRTIAAPASPTAPRAPGSSYDRAKDPLQAQYRLTRSNYDRLTAQSDELNRQRQALVSQPGVRRSILQPRLDSFTPAREQFEGVPGVNDAVREIDRRLAPIGEQRRALIPDFQRHAEAFREQAARNQTNLALRRVGAQPLATTPATAPVQPAAAPGSLPQIRFAGVDADPPGMFRNKAHAESAPQTFRTGDGRTAALPPGITMTMGANGVREFSGTGQSVAEASKMLGNRTAGITTQNFGAGTPRLTRGQPVASTFGLPVNDPRLDEQRARPAQAGQLTLNPGGNADTFNAREDREARAKLASDLDSQRFRLEMIAGNPGRRGRAALQALSENGQQRAALAGNAERLSAEAQQGRANRANTLANTGLEQQGLDRRSEQDILLRRDALAADQSGVSQVLNGENGAVSLLRRDGTVQGVQNPDGTPFRAPVQDRGQVTAADRLAFLRERMSGLEKTIADARAMNPTVDVSGFQAQLDTMNKQVQSLLAGPAQPTVAQMAALKSEPETAVDFDSKFGAGAAAKVLSGSR